MNVYTYGPNSTPSHVVNVEGNVTWSGATVSLH